MKILKKPRTTTYLAVYNRAFIKIPCREKRYAQQWDTNMHTKALIKLYQWGEKRAAAVTLFFFFLTPIKHKSVSEMQICLKTYRMHITSPSPSCPFMLHYKQNLGAFSETQAHVDKQNHSTVWQFLPTRPEQTDGKCWGHIKDGSKMLLRPEVCAVWTFASKSVKLTCVVVRALCLTTTVCLWFIFQGGECRQGKAGSPTMRALRMQENVPACTHTHDALKLTPTAFVTWAKLMNDFAFAHQSDKN